MSINIDPEKFAELVVKANPSKSEDAEDMAKSLELYINAYRLQKDILILLQIVMIQLKFFLKSKTDLQLK